MKKSIDLDETLKSLAEDEVKLINSALIWKHGGNLAVTIADTNDDGIYEADMSVLMWQTGKKKPLTADEEKLFKDSVTKYFNLNGHRVAFGGEVDFFEKSRKSDFFR